MIRAFVGKVLEALLVSLLVAMIERHFNLRGPLESLSPATALHTTLVERQPAFPFRPHVSTRNARTLAAGRVRAQEPAAAMTTPPAPVSASMAPASPVVSKAAEPFGVASQAAAIPQSSGSPHSVAVPQQSPVAYERGPQQASVMVPATQTPNTPPSMENQYPGYPGTPAPPTIKRQLAGALIQLATGYPAISAAQRSSRRFPIASSYGVSRSTTAKPVATPQQVAAPLPNVARKSQTH